MGKHGLDITPWLILFLETMEAAITTAQTRVQRVMKKILFWQKGVLRDSGEGGRNTNYILLED